jgi:hypothetical protein
VADSAGAKPKRGAPESVLKLPHTAAACSTQAKVIARWLRPSLHAAPRQAMIK